MLEVGGAHVGIAAFQRLLDNGHAARHMGRRHRGAVHAFIAAGHGRVDAFAGSGDFGLDGQLAGGAPGGEIRHAGYRGFHFAVRRRDGQHLVLLVFHVFAGCLRNKHGRHTPVGDGHPQHAGGVVVHDHGDGTGRIGVAHLLFVVQAAAAADQRDLAFDIHLGKIVSGTIAGNDNILQLAAARQAAQRAAALRVDGAVVIGERLAVDGDVGREDGGVGHGGNRQRLAVGRGLADVAVVGVGSKGTAAKAVVVGSTVVVACSHGDRNAMLAQTVEHVEQAQGKCIGTVIIDVAAGRAKAHVDGVDIQQNAVFQRVQNIGIGGAAGGKEHLHVDDLRGGGYAHDRLVDAGVAGGGGGNVGTMAAGIAGVAVGILIAIVKLEGNLAAVVQRRSSHTGNDLFRLEIVLVQQSLQGSLRQGLGGGGVLENFMAHVYAGIQNGDQHALAVKAGLVVQTAADHFVAAGRGGHQLKRRGKENGGEAVHLLDLLVLAVCNGGRKAVEQNGIAVGHLQRLALQNVAFDLCDSRILLVQQLVRLYAGIGAGGRIVHNDDDLHLCVIRIFGFALQLDAVILAGAAGQKLSGDLCRIGARFIVLLQLGRDLARAGGRRCLGRMEKRTGNKRQHQCKSQKKRARLFQNCHSTTSCLFGASKKADGGLFRHTTILL